MRIAIASDHAGFVQKDPLAEYLRAQGHEVVDCGPDSDERCDYPDYADKVARRVARGEVDRGVLICGTGLGIAMTADKVAGVRATPIQTVEFARLAREHNDANVIGLSGRFVSLEDNEKILDAFLTTEFGGGRHTARVEKMMREDDPAFPGVEA
ncbi:ribose 5-phosphate isomerase B [Olsenella sp. DSM 107455]|uniref:Ribose 5-phosphate isomerase B n=1 Tax=Thermophilibacter gallinarum TaxID=2779357 RepID=A0ABR9QTS7_9ACTN|nr:ribose 5-phosphate isomerase B [Thermophilibacter gallinarum]MBE5024476.1 ribose 5-phosphate isomerase B [Thermophilibacter gallinarum]